MPCSLHSIAEVTDMTVGIRYSQPTSASKVDERKWQSFIVESRKFRASLISFNTLCGFGMILIGFMHTRTIAEQFERVIALQEP